jgi:hypothetical protein
MTTQPEPSEPQQPTTTTRARVERRRDELVLRLPTLDRLLRACLPEETVQHLRAARREQLLAVRSLIDARIERLERAQAAAEERRRQVEVERTEIRVD